MTISVRIVLTDHYLTTVNAQFDPVYSKLRHVTKQVPIIRIFGPNEEGKKVCLHLHGVFPYLLIRATSTDLRYAEQLAQSLDLAINLATEKGDQEIRHVFDIQLVQLLPIYGYHEKTTDFWKIFFYNPSTIRKASELLLAGAVMNQEFQPHEAHIPFNLQFFVDYNLYGMNFILFKNGFLRESNAAEGRSSPTKSSIGRSSTCEKEYDVHIDDISNEPPQIGKRIANPGLQALWDGERSRRSRLSIHKPLTPATSPERLVTRAFPGEIRHHEKLKANIKKRPPGTEEEKPSTPVITEEIDLNSTISLEQIERVNSMSQQIDDEVLIQMMMNDEISDSQGIENDSILAPEVKPTDDEELIDGELERTTIENSSMFLDESSFLLSQNSTTDTNQPSSQTSEEERENLHEKLKEFFQHRSNSNSNGLWLESRALPPVRSRRIDPNHRKIATQIICQDLEDETPFVKLFSNVPEFVSKHYQRTEIQKAEEDKVDLFQNSSGRWFTPLKTAPLPELCRRSGSRSAKSKRPTIDLFHADSAKTEALFDKLGINRKPTRLLSNTSDSCSNVLVETNNDKNELSHECQYLTVVSFEIFCSTQEIDAFLLEKDEIFSIFYTLSTETPDGWRISSTVFLSKSRLDATLFKSYRSLEDQQIVFVENELELIEQFSNRIEIDDPDMIVCYDMKLSLYYLVKRAKSKYNIDLLVRLSRFPSQNESISRTRSHMVADGADVPIIVGRILLDLWKILRCEITLNIYTFENVLFHVLNQRVPRYDFKTVSNWFYGRDQKSMFGLRNFTSFLDYGWTRSNGNFRLIFQLDLINKTSEFARIYGIEFYQVLSRGSQYRVESMMVRLAKCSNYVMVTPDQRQRLHMRAPECFPLTMEPISMIYFTPIGVLDFQSLYPSIIIAHNICYSTCLGRIDQLDRQGPFKFGCTSLTVNDRIVNGLDLDKDVFCSPNGIAFLKKHRRLGVLPVMLEEILSTRVMIKNTMKLLDKKSTLYRTLDARQLCLKLIANVTFGYTSANFSGRMPCVEIGDTIVHTARSVLERAIEFIKNNPQFGGRVVYGDTDSLFIQFPQATRAQAFEQCHLLVKSLNTLYPSPIKIKFEKIYMASVLASKKRYVGLSFETVDQKIGKFDAKGIETVRRDTCPIVAKILRSALKLLFETRDVTRVRHYVQSECSKIIENRCNLIDFIFAKEYRGKNKYHPSAPVPALRIALERARTNPLAEPNQGERVPYLIGVNAENPNANLIDCVWTLDKVLKFKSQFQLNSNYYIRKQILPALDRCFALISVNVFKWIGEIPSNVNNKEILNRRCIHCSQLSTTFICNPCRTDDLSSLMIVYQAKANKLERQHAQMQRLCNSCSDRIDGWYQCSTNDCPVRFRLQKLTRLMKRSQEIRTFLDELY